MTTDEPGSPLNDLQTAEVLTELFTLAQTGGADARAGMGAILRRLKEHDHQALERIASTIQLARLRRSGGTPQ